MISYAGGQRAGGLDRTSPSHSDDGAISGLPNAPIMNFFFYSTLVALPPVVASLFTRRNLAACCFCDPDPWLAYR